MSKKFQLDLSKFKKIKEDSKSTTLKHPGGHEIRIAHGAVGPEMRDQLRSLPTYFNGGGVDKDSPAYAVSHSKAFANKDTSAPTPKPVNHDNNGEAMHAEAVARHKAQMEAEKSPKTPPNQPTQTAETDYEAQGGLIANYADGSDETISPDDATPEALSFGQKLGGDIRAAGSKAADWSHSIADSLNTVAGKASDTLSDIKSGITGEDPNSPPPAPAQEPTPPNAALPPSPSSQQPPTQGSPPPASLSPPGGAYTPAPGDPTLQKAYSNEMAGARGAADTMETAYDNQAQTLKDAQIAQHKIQTSFQDQLSKLQQERDSLTQDIQDTHIDPNRLFSNMGTGQKIASILGLIAGGIGGTLTGQGGNQALAYLNKLSDQDIDAQKADLGKKENLLSANFKKFGDLKEATVMTKLMQADQISSQLAQQAASTNSELEKSRLLTLRGQIQQGMAPAFQALAMQRAANQAAQDPNLDPASLIPYKVPEGERPKVAAEVDRAKNTRSMSTKLMEAYDKTTKDMEGLGKVGAAIKDPVSLQGLRLLINTTVTDLTGTARQAEFDSVSSNALPQVSDITAAQKASRRAAFQNYLNAKSASSLAKSYGIDLDKYKSTSYNPEIQLSPQDKMMVDYAKKYPNAPGSQAWLKKAGLK